MIRCTFASGDEKVWVTMIATDMARGTWSQLQGTFFTQRLWSTERTFFCHLKGNCISKDIWNFLLEFWNFPFPRSVFYLEHSFQVVHRFHWKFDIQEFDATRFLAPPGEGFGRSMKPEVRRVSSRGFSTLQVMLLGSAVTMGKLRGFHYLIFPRVG